MSMNERNVFICGLVSALTLVGAISIAVSGCHSPQGCGTKTDAEGFTWYSDADIGRATPAEPGEFYVLRFEYPARESFADRRKFFGIKWSFTEVRQLKDSVTMVDDGVLKPQTRRVPGRNWRAWLQSMSRNVRIKFVDENYSLAADGRKDAPAGFTSLFNGKDLAGWRGCSMEDDFYDSRVRRAMIPEDFREHQKKADELMKEHWHVRDGVLFFDGLKGGYNIAAEKDYGNFEVIADWRLLRVYGDSGFYMRSMPQVQIWDPNMWNGLGSGGIWNNSTALFTASVCADNPIGDWNRCRMRMIGNRISVWLNGVKVVDNVEYQNCWAPGKPIPLIDRFELQCHGDPIEFRNIFVKELPEDPADIPDPSKAVRGEKVNLLADGLAGWEATEPKARMGWSVKDGVLSNNTGIDPEKTSCGGAGTTSLKTKRADFYDFDFSCDVLVPAKCNSGIYLRGRYEIQVLDSFGRGKTDCHFMGALYDLVEPAVSAEKPAGEWQHIDLTIYKRHLTVVLNGVKIIDNKPIPGVTPGAIDGDEFVPGPILLQGDHSNASFKNMVLTPIVR
ncbi:MAG: DUF1080 domain-containing protein [Kiritimatiellae bacterium]|nr:DUF1080 domain-containing protein [Kiritimatiellia bacterium]